LSTSDTVDAEPFGFVDGISQPEVDWERRRPVRDQDQLEYLNLSCVGEFLLGYPNEYGRYTPRPLLAPKRDPRALLPRAEEAPERADLGRNGCYLVMRQLRQDVQGFWRELDRQAQGDPDLREQLAAAMVGRKKTGEPLAAPGGDPVGGGARRSTLNAFTYQDDPQGVRCPLGAHIRRANPRNADLPPGAPGIISRLCRMLGFDAAALEQDLIASTRFHRLLRRGRVYGAGADTGIHFICLAANIKRQFEFVQSAWLMGSRFAGLNESDPLLGHRSPDPGDSLTDGFSMPQADGPDRRLSGLPQFVTVLGGAYSFLPSIRALRYLATAR
jgi:deferrochelatase/peroxidase EfeB